MILQRVRFRPAAAQLQVAAQYNLSRLMVCLLFVGLSVVSLKAHETGLSSLQKLALSASGEALGVPDLAVINLAIVTQGKQASDALSENSTKMQKVIDALRQGGIEAKDIQTANLVVQPQYIHAPNALPRLSGYEARNTVTITLNNISKLGLLLDQVTGLGINTIDGPYFHLKDSKALEEAALLEAMEKLKQRAKIFEKGFGIKLGRVLALSENSLQQPVQPYRIEMTAQSKSVPIEAGELRITAQVNAEWEILPQP